MANLPPHSSERLAALESRFLSNFEAFDELGASVSVWHGERECLTLVGGTTDKKGNEPWATDTLVPVWSCTKGPAVAACLLAVQEAGLSLDTPVVKFWPTFGQAGKERLTLGQLLSHQAGLAALETSVEISDHGAVIRALEQQAPLWSFGDGHGYHPRTFGFLLEEVVRRLSGHPSLGQYFAGELAEPLGWDVWIGLPDCERHRVATIYPGRSVPTGSDEQRFLQALTDPDSLAMRAFQSPQGLHAVREMNDPEVWAQGYPAMGGLASARGLAGFYAFLAGGGQCAGTTFFTPETLSWMEKPLVQGEDRVLHRETAFAAGFMMDPVAASGSKGRQLFGRSARAFGHPGAGGSLAFADPEHRLGFAYVMNQMERSVFPTEKVLGLVEALYGEVQP